MAVIRERIKRDRVLRLPLRERKRLRFAPDIVDELVANEEFYLPEGA